MHSALAGHLRAPGVVWGAATERLSWTLGPGSQEMDTYLLPYTPVPCPVRIFLVTTGSLLWLLFTEFPPAVFPALWGTDPSKDLRKVVAHSFLHTLPSKPPPFCYKEVKGHEASGGACLTGHRAKCWCF